MEFAADGSAHEFDRAFDGFEHDVADKAVGDDDICLAVEDAVAFDVADKVEFAVLQQFVGLFDGVRTFDVFCADVDQPDARLSFLRMERMDEFAADNGKLGELFGGAVDVRCRVWS